MQNSAHTHLFETARPRLLGLAYRILGSRAEAEDAVQDTFVKFATIDPASLEQPDAWLTTVCTRRCLDLLRSVQRARTTYFGPWLPEPLHTRLNTSAEHTAELADSLTTAFILLLERLTPKERAAYLLREIFALDYAQIAATLDIQEDACRKLVSRAKANIDQARVRHQTPRDRQDQLLTAFQDAIQSGATEQLAQHLATDIRLTSDGGGKVSAAKKVIVGRDLVLTFIQRLLVKAWSDLHWRRSDLNHHRGFVLTAHGQPINVVTFAYDEHDRITDIFIVRNPDKLAHLEPVEIR